MNGMIFLVSSVTRIICLASRASSVKPWELSGIHTFAVMSFYGTSGMVHTTLKDHFSIDSSVFTILLLIMTRMVATLVATGDTLRR